MASYINIKTPIALTGVGADHDLGYFEPRFWVRDLNNSAISPQGVVFKNSLLLPGSLPERRRSRLKLALYAYKQKLTLSPKYLSLDKRYLLGFNPYSYGNYYHWLTEALPRLWVNRGYFSEQDVVLIPDSGITTVAKASMSAIGFLRHEVILKECITHSSRLVLAQSSARQAEYHSSLLEMRDAILARLGIRHSSLTSGDLIYISRGSNSARSVVNENQVVDELTQDYGFVVIEPHRLSFAEQVAAFAKARLAISIHGAALTNVLWMQPGASVIELYKHLDTCLGNVHTPPGLPSLCYLRLASVMGIDYNLLQCKAEDEAMSVNTSKLIVSLEDLRRFILDSLARSHGLA